MTDEEYQQKSQKYLESLKFGMRYTSIHGDHRLYHPSGQNDTCYGTHYDRRIIERMVKEGLISETSVDLERVAYLER